MRRRAGWRARGVAGTRAHQVRGARAHDADRRAICDCVDVVRAQCRRVDGQRLAKRRGSVIQPAEVAEAVANVRQVAADLVVPRAMRPLVQLARALLQAQGGLIAPVLAAEEAKDARLARKLCLDRLVATADARITRGVERCLRRLRPPRDVREILTPRRLFCELRAQLRRQGGVLALQSLALRLLVRCRRRRRGGGLRELAAQPRSERDEAAGRGGLGRCKTQPRGDLGGEEGPEARTRRGLARGHACEEGGVGPPLEDSCVVQQRRQHRLEEWRARTRIAVAAAAAAAAVAAATTVAVAAATVAVAAAATAAVAVAAATVAAVAAATGGGGDGRRRRERRRRARCAARRGRTTLICVSIGDGECGEATAERVKRRVGPRVPLSNGPSGGVIQRIAHRRRTLDEAQHPAPPRAAVGAAPPVGAPAVGAAQPVGVGGVGTGGGAAAPGLHRRRRAAATGGVGCAAIRGARRGARREDSVRSTHHDDGVALGVAAPQPHARERGGAALVAALQQQQAVAGRARGQPQD